MSIKRGQTTIAGNSGPGLPPQTGKSSKFLTTNGTTASWTTVLDSNGKLPPEKLTEAIQLVEELPENPVAGVLYLIAE